MMTRALTSLSTALVSGLLVAGTALPATAAKAASTIVGTPSTVTASADASTVAVKVSYKCTNTTTSRHYVSALLNQAGPDGWDLAYVAGYRGDTGGLVRAKCTGKTVSHVLTLKEGAYSNPDAELAKGNGSLTVSLERRGTGSGGVYNVIGTVTKGGPVTVR
jgi:hypothetical protein